MDTARPLTSAAVRIPPGSTAFALNVLLSSVPVEPKSLVLSLLARGRDGENVPLTGSRFGFSHYLNSYYAYFPGGEGLRWWTSSEISADRPVDVVEMLIRPWGKGRTVKTLELELHQLTVVSRHEEAGQGSYTAVTRVTADGARR